METLYRKDLKNIITQSILEHCADLLDEVGVKFNELRLGISDPEKRENSELHIRMADAAWREYAKTMFNESDKTQIQKLEEDKAELLEALEKIFNISNKPYRNTRNEELEIIDIARNLLHKFQKEKQ